MSKNLIYANADEFHVKSTVVYAKETNNTLLLYWDSEHTKPIYSDELERLYLAGGLKVDFGVDSTTFLSPIVFNRTEEEATVVCLAGGETKLVLAAPARSVSSDNALFPGGQVSEIPSH